MSTDSNIQWTDHTFNPWIGCEKVSAGCANCYAEAMMDKRWGKVKWGPKGTRKRTSDSNWKLPAKWNKEAGDRGIRYRVFCASLADVFEDRDEVEPWRHDLFNIIYECPNLDWQILSKRPQFALDWIGGASGMSLWTFTENFPHVQMGVSCEDQKSADERIPLLRELPASVIFLSLEPLQGPIDLTSIPYKVVGCYFDALVGRDWNSTEGWEDTGNRPIDWVIVGGESGPGAHLCDVRWIEAIVDECKTAGVPCFVKQLGANPMLGDVSDQHGWPESDGPVNWETGQIKLIDGKGGKDHEWPEHLRVREFPTVESH